MSADCPHYPALVLAPVGGLAASVLCHVSLSRLAGGRRQIVLMMLGTAAGALAMLVLGLWACGWSLAAPGAPALVALDLLAYLALSWCYFNFVNLILSSLRIRLLHEIARRGRPLGEGAAGGYGARDVIENRLERLVRDGQLVRRDGRYHAGGSSSYLFFFHVFEIAKHVVTGRGNRIVHEVARREGRGEEGLGHALLWCAGYLLGRKQ